MNASALHSMNSLHRLASCDLLAAVAASLAGCCSASSTAKRKPDSSGGAITILRSGEPSLDRGIAALPPRALPAPPLEPPATARSAPAVTNLPVRGALLLA
jgi:hypothetical protein